MVRIQSFVRMTLARMELRRLRNPRYAAQRPGGPVCACLLADARVRACAHVHVRVCVLAVARACCCFCCVSVIGLAELVFVCEMYCMCTNARFAWGRLQGLPRAVPPWA